MHIVLFYYQKSGVDCGTPDTLTTSVPEIVKTDEHIKIFPNPAGQYFNIHFETHVHYEMQIFSCRGEMVESQIINRDNAVIDCSTFTPGIYIICFFTDSNKYFRKLIIK